jgi:hypothetical protein
MIDNPNSEDKHTDSRQEATPTVNQETEGGRDAPDPENKQHDPFKLMRNNFRRVRRWLFLPTANHVIALAAVVTAAATITYTVYAGRQWHTLSASSAQTERLINETHTLATNAGTQATNAADQVKKLGALVEATNKQAVATAGQLSIMQGQLDASTKALMIQERPWVKISHRITSPLTFDIGGRQAGPVALMRVEDTLENVGQTVAVNVLSWEDVIPVDLDYSTTTARKRQAEWCDANRHPQGTAGYLLFPHDPLIQPGEIGPTMATIEKFTIHETHPPSRIDGTVAFVMVGCVCYRSSFEPVTNPTHQTRYMYWLGKPEAGGFFPNVIPRGSADQLRLISIPFYFTAD